VRSSSLQRRTKARRPVFKFGIIRYNEHRILGVVKNLSPIGAFTLSITRGMRAKVKIPNTIDDPRKAIIQARQDDLKCGLVSPRNIV
jgi:hypothetical protein